MSRQPAAPLVSVGLPVRNGGAQLSRALESLLGQSWSDLELLVSDNASTDDTADVARPYVEADARVSVRTLPALVPPEQNFNAALARARGRYFMWAAHDDTWEPDFVASMVGLLEARPDVVLAFCAFDNVDAHGAVVRDYPRVFELSHPDRLARLRAYVEQPGPHGKANLIYGLFRREVLAACGGMRRWGPRNVGVDMLAVLRVLAEGDVALHPATLFHKQVAPSEHAAAAAQPATLVERATRLRDSHGYYADCARVLRASPLPSRDRARLFGSLARLAAADDGLAVRARFRRAAGAPSPA